MTVYLVTSALFSFIIVAVAALTRQVRISMSQSTDTLFAAVSDLSVQVTAVAAKVAELKATQANPSDTAAVDKAVTDIQAATAALKAAIV